MKYLWVVALLTVSLTLGMGWRPKEEPVTKPPVVVTKPELKPPVVVTKPELKIQELKGYVWEDSDNRETLGLSGMVLPAGMKAFSVTIGGKDFSYRKMHNGNREVWYGPKMNTFEGLTEIVVVGKNNTLYHKTVRITHATPDEDEPTVSGEYQTRYHHTTTASSDGGKSLVLCPGQVIKFDRCESSGVNIPKHQDDKDRETYWNMFKSPKGDIVCTKDGKTYRYKAVKQIDYGSCK